MPLLAEDTKLIPFGKGVVAYVRRQPAPLPVPCPAAGGDADACSFVRVAPWTSAPALASALSGAARGSVGEWSKVQLTEPYSAMWPGVDKAFAVRADRGLTIDTVDAAGKVDRLVDIDGPEGGLHDVHVVETKRGILVVGLSNESELIVQPIEGGKAKAKKKLAFQVAPQWANAGWARHVASQKGRPALPDWGLQAAIDAKGELLPQAYLMLTEISPPPKGSAREGTDPGLKKGGKNGCGRPSRPLTDASVKKIPRLLTLSADGAVVKDSTIAVEPPFGDERPLELEAFPGGVRVMGKAFGPDHAEVPAPAADKSSEVKSPFLGAPLQGALAAAYDHVAREGAVLAEEGETLVLRRFDALGTPKGEPERAPAPNVVHRNHEFPSLATAGGAYGYLHPEGTKVTLFGGKRSGTVIDIPQLADSYPQRTLGIVRWDAKHVAVLRVSPSRGEPGPKLSKKRVRGAWRPSPERAGLLISLVDVETGTATPLSPLEGWPRDANGWPEMQSPVAAGVAGSALVVLGVSTDEAEKSTLHRFVRDGTSWKKEKVEGVGDVYPWMPTTTVSMPDEPVFFLRVREGAHALWGLSGKIAKLPEDAGPGLPRHAGPMLIPGKPGEVLRPSPATEKTLAGCPFVVPTAAARFVAACAERPEDAFTARVGLRVYRP